MKVLREKSREYKGKPYYKYKINIPSKIVKEAQLKEGDELQVEAKKGEIRLRRK